MTRDGFVFYRSFYEALECLGEKEAYECFKAVALYALDGVEIEMDGVVKALFLTMKPQIDANNHRYANGCKGGRPVKNQEITKEKPNENQTITKVQPKEKEKEKEKDKEKDKEKVKVKEKDKYGDNKLVSLSIDEYNKLVTDFGYEDTQAAIKFLDDYIADKGYKSKSNYAAIRRWVIDAVRQRKGNKQQTATIDDFFKQRIGG